MGSHHDHNDHSNEKKPVSFTVPLIFASAVVLVIILLVSLGDPKHGDCCCDEGKCASECVDSCKGKDCANEPCCEGKEHAGHAECHGTEAVSKEASADTAAVSTPRHEATDSTATKAEHKEEAHH